MTTSDIKIEVFHKAMLSRELLGTVKLDGSALSHFIREEVTQTQWFPLHMDMDPQEFSLHYSDIVNPFGEVKLRAGFAGATSAVEDSGEYMIQILSAYGLAKSDAFGKSDPFCIVEWYAMRVCGVNE